MAKSVAKVKQGLKLRTESKPNTLSVRLGGKRYNLPFEVRAIQSDDFLFVHVPPASAIFKTEGKSATVVSDLPTAEAASKSLRRNRKKKGMRRGRIEMPSELASALSKVPAGYKLGYDASGAPRLVKKRVRRPKS